MQNIEIIPAILRNTFEKIEEDWNKVVDSVAHIQIDIPDGVFAGDRGFLDIVRLADLPASSAGELAHSKLDLHMMVQTPADFVDDIIDVNPARCAFHIEAFAGSNDLPFVYNTIGEYTSAQMGLAINPDTPIERMKEYLPIVQYILFMGYNPGYAGQELHKGIFEKIKTFHTNFPHITLAADGHVDKETIVSYAGSGISMFYSNSAIFKSGNPKENIKQLELLAASVVSS